MITIVAARRVKNADYAEDDGREREEKNLNQDQDPTENEEPDNFPTREAGQIMAGEKERETDRGDDPGHADAGHFEFEIRADNAEQQEKRREGCDPESQPFEAARLDSDQGAFEAGFFSQVSYRIGNPVREQGLSVDLLGGLLRVQCQQRSFWVHDAVADFHFF